MTYRFTEGGPISIHDDRWFIPPWGVNGGHPAQRSWKSLERSDGTQTSLPARCDRVEVPAGDQLHFVTWGAGGWGDPPERNAALVALEVRRGPVSAQAAASSLLSPAPALMRASSVRLPPSVSSSSRAHWGRPRLKRVSSSRRDF
jgi:N-methylhydantoinase B/oxoprolinase/acetone carboxylase alpha subunit